MAYSLLSRTIRVMNETGSIIEFSFIRNMPLVKYSYRTAYNKVLLIPGRLQRSCYRKKQDFPQVLIQDRQDP